MVIRLIQENKLQITLSPEDLLQLDITYESLDYINPKTKNAVAFLLKTAKEETGFEADDGKLLIEVYPLEDEGCTLYFTILIQKGGEVKSVEPVIFEFSDVDLLINSCCKLKKQLELWKHAKRFKSTAYAMNGKYYLLVFASDYAKTATGSFLQEFSTKVAHGKLAASFLLEHGNCLVKDNAVDLFSKYFSH